MKALLPIEKIARTLICPHISEKSTRMMQSNQHVFRVAVNATKVQIKKAVEAQYKVEVSDVNLLRVKGKVKGMVNKRGSCKDWKKAYVTLAEGHKIIETGSD